MRHYKFFLIVLALLMTLTDANAYGKYEILPEKKSKRILEKLNIAYKPYWQIVGIQYTAPHTDVVSKQIDVVPTPKISEGGFCRTTVDRYYVPNRQCHHLDTCPDYEYTTLTYAYPKKMPLNTSCNEIAFSEHYAYVDESIDDEKLALILAQVKKALDEERQARKEHRTTQLDNPADGLIATMFASNNYVIKGIDSGFCEKDICSYSIEFGDADQLIRPTSTLELEITFSKDDVTHKFYEMME